MSSESSERWLDLEVQNMVQAVKWESGKLVLLDQRYLPDRVDYVSCADFREISRAIADMVVRGAPAIGIAGGYGIASAAREAMESCLSPAEAATLVRHAASILTSARPTAVNLKWAVDRVLNKALLHLGVARLDRSAGSGCSGSDGGLLREAFEAALSEARAIELEDVETNRRIGQNGASLLKPNSRVLTHCNAGALATGGYGTALGVIRSAFEQGKVSMVYADETRPYLQGARLTAWELLQDGIPVTLLVDSAAGYLMSQSKVDCIIVGADRIARNGDTANKIGTYALACLAKMHGVPFYVAAPASTFDLDIVDGSGIPVEERGAEEVLSFRGTRVAPQGAMAFNPAFDVTPSELISAIVTEKGVIGRPIAENLPKVIGGSPTESREPKSGEYGSNAPKVWPR